MKNFIPLALLIISINACSQKQSPPDGKNTQNQNNQEQKPVQDNKITYSTADFKKYFDQYGVQGSFMLYDAKNNKYTYYDSARCYVRYSPASTFKIPNSLIGLETGVIADENFVIPWDSVKRKNENWNKDMDLKTAVKVSCVPYFQELARRVGAGKMQDFLDKFNYGNKDISDGIDKFWLTGSLKISQAEQIEFLKKFYNGSLPVSKRSMDIVRSIIILDEKPEFIFRGKTGWAQSDGIDIGWLVGWVETKGNVYIYATNVESKPDNQKFNESRRAITEKILKELEILP